MALGNALQEALENLKKLARGGSYESPDVLTPKTRKFVRQALTSPEKAPRLARFLQNLPEAQRERILTPERQRQGGVFESVAQPEPLMPPQSGPGLLDRGLAFAEKHFAQPLLKPLLGRSPLSPQEVTPREALQIPAGILDVIPLRPTAVSKQLEALKPQTPSEKQARTIGKLIPALPTAFAPQGAGLVVGGAALRAVGTSLSVLPDITIGGMKLFAGKWPTRQELFEASARGAGEAWTLAASANLVDKIAARFAPHLTLKAMGGLKSQAIRKLTTPAATRFAKRIAKVNLQRALLETPVEATVYTALDALDTQRRQKILEHAAENFLGSAVANTLFAGLSTGFQSARAFQNAQKEVGHTWVSAVKQALLEEVGLAKPPRVSARQFALENSDLIFNRLLKEGKTLEAMRFARSFPAGSPERIDLVARAIRVARTQGKIPALEKIQPLSESEFETLIKPFTRSGGLIRLRGGQREDVLPETVAQKIAREGVGALTPDEKKYLRQLNPEQINKLRQEFNQRPPQVLEAENILKRAENTGIKQSDLDRLFKLRQELPENQRSQLDAAIFAAKLQINETRPVPNAVEEVHKFTKMYDQDLSTALKNPYQGLKKGEVVNFFGEEYRIQDFLKDGQVLVRSTKSDAVTRVFDAAELKAVKTGDYSKLIEKSLRRNPVGVGMGTRLIVNQNAYERLPEDQKEVLEKLWRGFEEGRKARELTPTRLTLRAKTNLLDHLAPIEEIVEEAQKRGVNVYDKTGVTPYDRLQLINGLSGKIEDRIDTELKPILVRNKDRLSYLSAYLIAQREEEIMQRSGKPGLQVFGGKLRVVRRLGRKFKTSLNQKEIQKVYEAIRNVLGEEEFVKLQRDAQLINDNLLRLLKEYQESGMISAQDYQQIAASNQRYVPFEVVDYIAEKITKGQYTKRAINVGSEPLLKELRGTERLKADPLESIPKKYIRFMSIAEHNRAMQQFINLARQNPIMQDLITPYKGGPIPKGKDVISAFFDGKKEEYLVDLPVAQALKSSDKAAIQAIDTLLLPSANLLRATATGVNLAFMLSNIPRDVFDALVSEYTEGGLSKMINFAFHLPRGFATAIKQDETYKLWVRNGGGRSTLSRQFFDRPDLTVKALAGVEKKNLLRRAVERAVHGISEGIRISEESTRLAKFMSDMEVGQTHQLGIIQGSVGKTAPEAAIASRRITLDFASGGRVIKILNLWVPYLNAAFLTLQKVRQLIKTNPRGFVWAGALAATPAVLAYAHNRQFRDYQDIEDWEKDSYFLLMVRDRTPEEIARKEKIRVLKIPKGWIGAILVNPVEHFLEFVDQTAEGKTSLDVFFADFVEQVSPVGFPISKRRAERTLARVLPTAFRVPVEILAGVNFFTGRPVIPQSLRDVEPAEQFKPYTSPTLVAIARSRLGQRLGISPLAIDSLLNSATGSLTQQVLNVLDEFVIRFTDIEKTPGLDIAQRGPTTLARVSTPFIKRFYGSYGGKQEQAAFDRILALDKQVKTENLKERRLGEYLYRRLKEAGNPTRARLILQQAAQSGKLNRDVYQGIIDAYEKDQKNLTNVDRALLKLRVDQRARFILGQLITLGDRKSRIQYLAELISKGVLTEQTLLWMAILNRIDLDQSLSPQTQIPVDPVSLLRQQARRGRSLRRFRRFR